ncbi:hypothetical protein Tco_0096955 [Tanacetum coccineum]
MCKQCLVTANHDVCVLNYVNDMNSRADNQSANVSKRENQKKHKANAKKSKELGSKGSLASSRPSKSRTCLRWIPTGRIFSMCGKLTASSKTENKSEKSVCDSASTSNPSEPSSKGFLISTSFLGSWKVYSVICSTNYSNEEKQVVSKSSDVTTADASDKRHQQQDSTSSTSTLATTITADGNFDLFNIVMIHIVQPSCQHAMLNDSTSYWLCLRLGHVYFKRMQDMSKGGFKPRGLVSLKSENHGYQKKDISKDGLVPAFDMDTKNDLCDLHATPSLGTEVLELIHSDLCDLHATPSLGNKKYFVTFIDDASRYLFQSLGTKSRGFKGTEDIGV